LEKTLQYIPTLKKSMITSMVYGSVWIITQLLCLRKRYFCKCHFSFRHLLTCPVQLSKFEIHIQQIDRWWQQYHLLILMWCFPGLHISHLFLVSDDGMILAWSSYMYCEISQNVLSARFLAVDTSGTTQLVVMFVMVPVCRHQEWCICVSVSHEFITWISCFWISATSVGDLNGN
jgi:hypothetical protein